MYWSCSSRYWIWRCRALRCSSQSPGCYVNSHILRWRSLSPVRGTSKKNEKRKRAEAVEDPSPGGVWGGNGRALTGSKGPYLLGRMNLKAGLNRPVQSQAVNLNWATVGLLAGPLACWWAFPAARRRQQPQATYGQRPKLSVPPFRPSIMYSSWMPVSVHAHWHR